MWRSDHPSKHLETRCLRLGARLHYALRLRHALPSPCSMPFFATPLIQHRLLIVAAVLGFHVAGLWALQTGFRRQAVEDAVQRPIMASLIAARRPEVTPRPPAQPTEALRPVSTASPTPQPSTAAAPQPMALASTPPAPEAPTGASAQVPAPVALLAAISEPSPAPPSPPRIELPSSNAGYLNNPRPPYPPLSKRLGEQGQVLLRVFIEANGTASQAEVRSSSGYDRLDQAALQTVLKWRYTPGTRNGVAEGMWFNVPLHFVLE
jgi:periplasmic protein TonB